MGTICCPHPSPLSREQDWYSQELEPVGVRRVQAYETRKVSRDRRVERKYAEQYLKNRRRRIYEETVALLAASGGAERVQALAVSADRIRVVQAQLKEHAEKWDRETAHLSSPLQRMMHPSYQAILGISAENADSKRATIKFLLNDLKRNERDWFMALSYLTHENPISSNDYGKPSRMIAAWLQWGSQHGLLDK